MNNQRIVLRASFRLENTLDSLRIERIRRKAIYRFCGNTHNFSGAKQRTGFFNCRRIFRRTQQFGLHDLTFFYFYSYNFNYFCLFV